MRGERIKVERRNEGGGLGERREERKCGTEVNVKGVGGGGGETRG